MLHTQSNPVLHGNLVALDLELCLPSHVLNSREAGKMAGKASRRAFGLASVLCRARDYYLGSRVFICSLSSPLSEATQLPCQSLEEIG
jgi:hypothetical protein